MIEDVKPIAELTASERQEMHALFDHHFEGVSRDQFDADLDEKNWAILLRSDDGTLVGFSTLLVYDRELDGELLTVVYSGDTIVARVAWNSSALPRAWIAAVNRIRAGYRGRRCFWLLITSGFRTYRFLPLFWQDFYPRFDRATPPSLQRVLEALARDRFGDAYDPQQGIVRFMNPQRLRGDLAGIPVERMGDPHVAFFDSRNPGHARGDELVSLCELSEANLTRAGQRMVRGR